MQIWIWQIFRVHIHGIPGVSLRGLSRKTTSNISLTLLNSMVMSHLNIRAMARFLIIMILSAEKQQWKAHTFNTYRVTSNYKKNRIKLKITGSYDGNFVVIDGIRDCHKDNLRCHQWWQCWRHGENLCNPHDPSAQGRTIPTATFSFMFQKTCCAKFDYFHHYKIWRKLWQHSLQKHSYTQ